MKYKNLPEHVQNYIGLARIYSILKGDFFSRMEYIYGLNHDEIVEVIEDYRYARGRMLERMRTRTCQ